MVSLDEKYKTGFSFLEDEEPEKAVNDWISEVTNNKIKKLYGENFILVMIMNFIIRIMPNYLGFINIILYIFSEF